MDVEAFLHLSIIRLLIFLSPLYLFLSRELPKAEWRLYLGTPLYWLVVVLCGYYVISGMVAAGMHQLFTNFTESGTVSSDLADQLTIFTLGLLFLYRAISRSASHDESSRWLKEFVIGIVTSYIATSALFFAFADFLDKAPGWLSFSDTLTAYIVLLFVFVADLIIWFETR